MCSSLIAAFPLFEPPLPAAIVIIVIVVVVVRSWKDLSIPGVEQL